MVKQSTALKSAILIDFCNPKFETLSELQSFVDEIMGNPFDYDHIGRTYKANDYEVESEYEITLRLKGKWVLADLLCNGEQVNEDYKLIQVKALNSINCEDETCELINDALIDLIDVSELRIFRVLENVHGEQIQEWDDIRATQEHLDIYTR